MAKKILKKPPPQKKEEKIVSVIYKSFFLGAGAMFIRFFGKVKIKDIRLVKTEYKGNI